mmetsp:Transcript_27095/g.19535  ORF Transcript_27095/g.19535 Transcript_27095/m.19535 type:complete len:107 (-) Transcript_27095:473-793(-)
MKKPVVCYYKLLNVSASASSDEIKSEYYKLAKTYHPDTVKNNDKLDEKTKSKQGELFKQITEAYSILGDSDKRDRYDKLIFGSDYQKTNANFENQDAYEYWKSKDE